MKVLLFVSSLSCLLLTKVFALDYVPPCSKGVRVEAEESIGTYHFRIKNNRFDRCGRLEIYHNHRLVFHDEEFDGRFYLGAGDGLDGEFYKFRTSNPFLVVSKYSGGMHCCFSLMIFELGKRFKKILDIFNSDFRLELVDLNGDGLPEIRYEDGSLANRFTSFADSPHGVVVLKYSGGKFALAEEFMRQPPPQENFIASHIKEWQEFLRQTDGPLWPPPSFLQAVTDYVYTGNVDYARKFIDRVWPSDVPEKEKFIGAYNDALSGSSFTSKLRIE